MTDKPIYEQLADIGREQEPVAWLRIQEHENRPTTIHLCDSDHPKAFKVYATRPQPASSQAKSLALLDLDSVEHMQGGANGPTIRLRGFINAQTGPVAPQPPIDNAFVADGCEQFSPPSEPAPVPCCGKYETCSHACTPRGKWLGRREAESERAIVPPGYAACSYPHCSGEAPEDRSCCRLPFTSAMADAAEQYWRSVGRFAHPLPAEFRWVDCFNAMIAAAKNKTDGEISHPTRSAKPE